MHPGSQVYNQSLQKFIFSFVCLRAAPELTKTMSDLFYAKQYISTCESYATHTVHLLPCSFKKHIDLFVWFKPCDASSMTKHLGKRALRPNQVKQTRRDQSEPEYEQTYVLAPLLAPLLLVTNPATASALMLINLEAPSMFAEIVYLLLANSLQGAVESIDFLEFFAGCMRVTSAWCRRGYRGKAYDVKYDPVCMDFCGTKGFITAIILVLQLVPGASSLAAPVCSSWVWMNRSTAGRKIWKILGREDREGVRLANLMVSRLVLLLVLMSIKGVWWIVEQPASSLMEYHPRWQWYVKRFAVYRVLINMGDYGAKTRKPSYLYSNMPWLGDLTGIVADCMRPVSVPLAVRSPSGSVSGISDSLKESQEYPTGFGHALAEVREDHVADLRRHVAMSQALLQSSIRGMSLSDVFACRRPGTSNLWRDAKLLPIRRALGPP